MVADDVKLVVINNNPKSHSYHSVGQFMVPGLKLMARLGIKEGPEWAYKTLFTKDGKGAFKIKAVNQGLAAYGANAKEVVERIKSDECLLKQVSNGRMAGSWKAILEAIEKGERPTQKMISFEEAMQGKVAK